MTVCSDKRDGYGRRLVEVLLSYGGSLNQEVIKAGLSCWLSKYSKNQRLAEVERQAQIATKGLWVEPHPGATPGIKKMACA